MENKLEKSKINYAFHVAQPANIASDAFVYFLRLISQCDLQGGTTIKDQVYEVASAFFDLIDLFIRTARAEGVL